jgi:hypothetical protein
MKICAHGIREHIRLLAPLFALIAAVWALRMVLAAAGAPIGLVRVFSVTVAVPVCVMLAVLLIHIRRFGSYPNVVAASLLLVSWAQLLIVAAIAFSALTGMETVYTEPEFNFGMSYWKHIAGHLTFGVGMGTLFGAAMGCLLLWMLRKMPATPEQHVGRH